MKVTDEYFKAFQDRKISSILDVGRRKGEFKRSGVRKWHDHGLTVVIDDKNFTMVATFRGELVAAALHDRCEFHDGDWFNIVAWNQMQIEEVDRKEKEARCREMVNKLMGRGMN